MLRGYARSSLARQLAGLRFDSAVRNEKLRRLAQRTSDMNATRSVDRVHLIVLPYSSSTRRLRFKQILRKHVSKFMLSDAAVQLAMDTWPSIVACKAFSNMFLENYLLNAPVDVGGRGFV